MNTHRIKKLASTLYVQVIVGITAGVLLGHFHPAIGLELKPLGDLFIKLIRMLLAPIIFASVVVGIARIGSIKPKTAACRVIETQTLGGLRY